MTSFALITPWPPQHSGIADYAYDLAKALLKAGISLHVYTSEANPKPLEGVSIISGEGETFPPDFINADRIIYQLGNNTNFHLWMLPWLEKYPGIIQVHDLVMHHIAAWETFIQRDETAYLDLMQKWYGDDGLEAARNSIVHQQYIWDSEEVTLYPLIEEYVGDAHAILVHSRMAQRYLRRLMPEKATFSLPQLYDLSPRQKISNSLERIIVLGGVDPQKRLEWVLDALRKVSQRRDLRRRPLRLDIAGGIDPRCERLVADASQHKIPGLDLQVHGRVTESEFEGLFRNADCCIALRSPTMGETSAVVMRALQYGLPTIVNDIGWYSELPDAIVKKVPVKDCGDRLADFIDRMIADSNEFSEWSIRCHEAAETRFSSNGYGIRYASLCMNSGAEEFILEALSETMKECGITGSEIEHAIVNKIVRDISF